MEIPFPFCVPVAAGIVSVSWETLFLLYLRLFSYVCYVGDPFSPPEREAVQGENLPDPRFLINFSWAIALLEDT